MKLQMPKILHPALGLPLDIDVFIEIDEKEDMELIKTLSSKGWIDVNA